MVCLYHTADDRAVRGIKSDIKPHAGRKRQNVGKKDCRIHAENIYGKMRDFRRQVRIAEHLFEKMFLPKSLISRKAAAGLAHEPDGDLFVDALKGL